MKAKCLSSDEHPVILTVSSSNVLCAYAYIRWVADIYFLFALESCVAKGSTGQDSDDWPLFELRCSASNTILKKSFFLVIIKGFRKIFP